MIGKFLSRLGLRGDGARTAVEPTRSGDREPYADPAANRIYELLFCDRPALYAPKPGEAPTAWQRTLFGEPADLRALESLARDSAAESRVRLLACHQLRRAGRPAVSKELLGVVVEIRLPGGLDTLAAFRDGGIRYINQTGKMSIVEGGLPGTAPLLERLFDAAWGVVLMIGPWTERRLPPPDRDHVRLSFLVSDGLYFGEGPLVTVAQDLASGPVLRAATALLKLVVDASAHLAPAADLPQ